MGQCKHASTHTHTHKPTMTSGLGFGLWIYSNRTLNSRALVFHSSTPTPSPPHLSPTSFNSPPSLLLSFIPPLFFTSLFTILNPNQAIIISLSFTLFRSLSLSLFLSFHPLPSPFCTSILASIRPSLHVLIPLSLHASRPPGPLMCLLLVKKQHRSQIVLPLTC